MIIQLEKNIDQHQKSAIIDQVKSMNYKPVEVITQKRAYILAIGKKEIDIRLVGSMKGVQDIHRVSDDYKLVSRKWKVKPTAIDLGDGVQIGGGALTMMAGPCSIESEEQIREVVSYLKQNNISIMRGGVYKPRSSPYSFRGMGIEGLKMWHELAKEAGIKIITEVMQVEQIEPMYDFIDIYQVGARNTQNFNLLDALGSVDKPVLIKRGISGTIEELLYSAEYVFSAGNENLMLCERGIRTYERASRNTFDINAIPILKEKTHLPVIADPSHAIGIRRHVEQVTLAAVAAGADGIIYELHPKPEEAASDGQQTLNFEESDQLMKKIKAMREVLVD